MSNPVSVDIKDKLVASGLGTFAATTGWAIYVGSRPEAPDDVISIYDTQGTNMNPLAKGVEIGKYTFQIQVRAGSYVNAHDKIEAIEAVLDRLKLTVGSTYYSAINRVKLIAFSGYDADNRAIWVQDYTAIRQIDTP